MYVHCSLEKEVACQRFFISHFCACERGRCFLIYLNSGKCAAVNDDNYRHFNAFLVSSRQYSSAQISLDGAREFLVFQVSFYRERGKGKTSLYIELCCEALKRLEKQMISWSIFKEMNLWWNLK